MDMVIDLLTYNNYPCTEDMKSQVRRYTFSLIQVGCANNKLVIFKLSQTDKKANVFPIKQKMLLMLAGKRHVKDTKLRSRGPQGPVPMS